MKDKEMENEAMIASHQMPLSISNAVRNWTENAKSQSDTPEVCVK